MASRPQFTYAKRGLFSKMIAEDQPHQKWSSVSLLYFQCSLITSLQENQVLPRSLNS